MSKWAMGDRSVVVRPQKLNKWRLRCTSVRVRHLTHYLPDKVDNQRIGVCAEHVRSVLDKTP